MNFIEFVYHAYSNAKSKGFWDDLDKVQDIIDASDVETGNQVHRAFQTQKLMLIVSELGEAVEALRKNDFNNFQEEIADVWIRLADFTGGYIGAEEMEEEIQKKMAYNSGRPPKHGKAF